MKTIAILVSTIITAASFAAPADMEVKPSVICARVAPGKDDNSRPIYDDDDYVFVSRGFGPKGEQTPGFFVFSKTNKTWLRIDKVSTKDGTFGRSPNFEECREAGKGYPSVGWNFGGLADKDYADLPLHTSGSISFPDKIERDKDSGEFILHFHSGWGIDGVETILKFKESDLQKAFETAKADAENEDRATGEE